MSIISFSWTWSWPALTQSDNTELLQVPSLTWNVVWVGVFYQAGCLSEMNRNCVERLWRMPLARTCMQISPPPQIVLTKWYTVQRKIGVNNNAEFSSGSSFLNVFFIKPTENTSCSRYFLLLYSKTARQHFQLHQAGRLGNSLQFCTVTRVSHHELLNQCFVVIHNFLSIIHANVRVVYLIVLLTIKSNFLKILKDRKFNQHNYFSDAMLLSILNLLNSSLIYVPFWRKNEFNQTIRMKT